jgi:hypothetical protein
VSECAENECPGCRLCMHSNLVARLTELAQRFHKGWHDGLEIDASDLMTLEEAVVALRAGRDEPTVMAEPVRRKL